MPAMRILIANDDGYLAPGLSALVEAMRGLGEIDVIAPERNASGTSNALTLDRPLQVFEARDGALNGDGAYALYDIRAEAAEHGCDGLLLNIAGHQTSSVAVTRYGAFASSGTERGYRAICIMRDGP